MTKFMLRGVGAAIFALAGIGATTANAQESTNRVSASTDWSVFVEDQPSKECWGVSQPKETINTKDGKSVAVKRGKILLFVTYRPGKTGEVSFAGGYPFAEGSTVELDVDGTKFNLFSTGENAWSGTAEDDAKIIAKMKSGTSAILRGHSSRGTNTQDKFSLLGFTAAMDEAAKRCS